MSLLTCDRNIYLPEWNFTGNSRLSFCGLNFFLFKSFLLLLTSFPRTEPATIHFVIPTRNFGDTANSISSTSNICSTTKIPAHPPPNITQIHLLFYISIVDFFVGFWEAAADPARDSNLFFVPLNRATNTLHPTRAPSLLPKGLPYYINISCLKF